jgi:hypothetical protein
VKSDRKERERRVKEERKERGRRVKREQRESESKVKGERKKSSVRVCFANHCTGAILPAKRTSDGKPMQWHGPVAVY